MTKEESLEEQLRKVKAKDSEAPEELIKEEKPSDDQINNVEKRIKYLINSYEVWGETLFEKRDDPYYSCCINVLWRFDSAIDIEVSELKNRQNFLKELKECTESQFYTFSNEIKEKENKYGQLKNLYSQNKFRICNNKKWDNFLLRRFSGCYHPKENTLLE
ncbi:hypothetical protein GOV06_01505 [Candidatus Woesearchaeota archaeon]|nr:hypothetical protein [Candidatus Woesearchaeota archaeon]